MAKNEYKIQASKRDDVIAAILKNIAETVNSTQAKLLRSVIEQVVDKLETKDGFILNNAFNKRVLLSLDYVFKQFSQTHGVQLIKTIIDSTQKILDFNTNYFAGFGTAKEMLPIHQTVKENISAWLGITQKNGIEPNGYLDTLFKDDNIKNQIRNQMAKSIITKGGFESTNKGIAEFIAGKPGQTGAFDRYYRNFVYDTFSQIDRATAQVYADKLGLDYAIYEGGLIETSRKFCIKRNGKVFTREEIELFDPTEARPPGYNPFTDLGGYGCRHHLNWVPKIVAFALRPDLKDL